MFLFNRRKKTVSNTRQHLSHDKSSHFLSFALPKMQMRSYFNRIKTHFSLWQKLEYFPDVNDCYVLTQAVTKEDFSLLNMRSFPCKMRTLRSSNRRNIDPLFDTRFHSSCIASINLNNFYLINTISGV